MTFTARYYGSCFDCGERIEPGDEVAYRPGTRELLCENCALVEGEVA